METLPISVRDIQFCSSYCVYCDGKKHLVVSGHGGEQMDSANVIAARADEATVVDGSVDCSRMYCHGRDASRVIQEQVSEWMRKAE